MNITRLRSSAAIRLPKLSINVPKISRVIMSAAVGGALTLLPVGSVLALSDVAAPELTNAVLISPATMDISDPGGNIYVNIDASDPLSGMSGSSELRYVSPSGKQVMTGPLQQRPDFTATDQWQFDANVPQYAETGSWTPSITMLDGSGNKHVWSNGELLSHGWDLGVTLTGPGDTTAPTLLTAQLATPSSLDSSTTNAVQIDMTTFDDLSSVSGSSELKFTSPSGKQVQKGSIYPDGTGNWIGQVNLLPLSENGTWKPTITLLDSVGNKAVYNDTELTNMGINLYLSVSGLSDTTAPTVNSLEFSLSSPVVDNVPYGGAYVSVKGTFADDNSGVAGVYIDYTSTDGQVASGQFTPQPDGSQLTTLTLPSYAQSGSWSPHLSIQDNAGNITDLNDTDLKNKGMDISFGVTKNITKSAAAGATVTSDEENDGATLADPVETSVTTPSGGNVSIVVIASSTVSDQTNGYQFFDRQISVSAPQETVESPLTLSFRIDSSKVPTGEDENSVQVTRNAVVIPACTDATTATPDPCVFSRQRLSDGDIRVSIHSTTASVWGSGFPIHVPLPTSKYNFSGYSDPVQGNSVLNKVKAGATIPIKFGLGGNFGASILATGFPRSQQVNCSTNTPVNDDSLALSTNQKGLMYTGDKYQYNWQTTKVWTGTCRMLSFKLDDSTTFTALFKF
jgi:hypothetical protein